MQARKNLTNEELSTKATALIDAFDYDTNKINGETYSQLADKLNRIQKLKNEQSFDELAHAINDYETLLKQQSQKELPVENVDEETEIDPKIYDYLQDEKSELATEAESLPQLSLLCLISATDRFHHLCNIGPKITEVRNTLLETQRLLDEHLSSLYKKASEEAKLQATKVHEHLQRTRQHLGLVQKAEENIAETKEPQSKFGYFNTPELPEDKPVFCTLEEAHKKLEAYFKRQQNENKIVNISCAKESKFKGIPVHFSKIKDDAQVRYTASTFRNDKQETTRYAMISHFEPDAEVFSAEVHLQNLPTNIKRTSKGFLINSVSIPGNELMIQAHDIVENVRYANTYNPEATTNYTLNESLRELAEAIDLYCKLKGYNDFKVYGVSVKTTQQQVSLLKATMGEQFKEMDTKRLAVIETKYHR